MITDGLCRGVFKPGDEASVAALYDAMRGLVDKRSPDLARLGYLPLDRNSSGAGTTLEYGVADFALALAANRLGHADEVPKWLDQAARWRNLFDPTVTWIRPRYSDGRWLTPFDPSEETGFQEGNSWQYTWLAPHDARRLFDAIGGDAVAVQRLDNLFRFPAEVQTRATLFGLVYRTDQYAPGNEHDLQVPWMYAFAGQPAKGQAALRDVQSIFRATPDGLPGNDDLGSLSAWHVFSALGFGPVTPGAPFYVVGSPLFPHAELRPAGSAGAPFVIDAPATSTSAKYVRSARLSGAPLTDNWFVHGRIVPGATLRLEMGTAADTGWGTSPGSRPPSVGAPLEAFGCR
jgi:predicted alpha-1,2-mannosidase